MKKLFLFAIILSLLIPAGSVAEKTIYDEGSILYNIMNELEGSNLQEDTIFNGIIFKSYMAPQEMESLGEELKEKLDIQGIEIDPLIEERYNGKFYTKEMIVDENFGQISYIGQDKYKNNIAIILNTYYNQEELSGETYLYINIVKDSDLFKNNDIIEGIKSIYKGFDSNVEITSCLIGEISNKMVYNDRVRQLKKVIKKLNGNIVEEFTDMNMISFTAYTPHIDKYISLGKNRINLNIAIRYSELDNKHYIWLGTPIITIGY